MLSNITIGQYYPTNSYIHSLDPRLKLISVMVYIGCLFFIDKLLGYVLAAACLFLVIYASKVPVSYIFKSLKGIIFIIAFTTFFNMFFTEGSHVLFTLFGLSLTLEGILIAIKMAVRLSLIVAASSILTLTTSPIQLTNAIESCLRPLKVFKVPSHEIAMMMTIALRFIPTLLEETDKIMKAQIARGADFDTGGLIKRAKGLIPLLVPLFFSAFRRAEELAVAMEARCYRGDINRTRMKELRFDKTDYISILLVFFFVLIVIALKVF